MTTNRPLIAVTPLMDYGRDSLWMLPGYMEAIMRAGGTPVMLPLTDDTDILAQCAERFDAFLFTGGPHHVLLFVCQQEQVQILLFVLFYLNDFHD